MDYLTGTSSFEYDDISTNIYVETSIHVEIAKYLLECNYFSFEDRCNSKKI